MKKFLTIFAIAAASAVAFTACKKDNPKDEPAQTTGLAFAQSEYTVFVGEKVTVEVINLQEGETVSYKPGDKAIATITSKGVVSGKAVGETTITATSKLDETRTATATVKVVEKPAGFVQITTLNVTPKTLTLKEGATSSDKLSAEIAPADATNKDAQITWSVDKSDVVKINADNTVTALKEGTAVITASVKDTAEGYDNTVTGTCTVTVTSANIPTTGITLSNTSLKLQPGKTAELTATLTPEEHTDSPSITWSSSNTSVATVANGVVTAVKEGSATITAKISDAIQATCDVTVADVELMMNAKTCFFDYEWPSSLETLDNVSMEIWVLTEGASGNQSIIGVEGAFLLRTESNQWQLICGGDVKANEEYDEIKLATSYNDDLNKWTHLAAVYSRNGKAALYVNGELKAEADLKDHGVPMNGITKSDGNKPQWGLPFSFFIGNACDAGRFVQGSLAYARIWKKALTASEVSANMYKANVTGSDLIASWYFTEGSGNTIADHSGNGRTLTAKTSDKATPKATISETDIEWIEGSLPAVN